MLKSSLCLFLLSFLHKAYSSSVPGTRIVGGTTADISSYPYQVLLLISGTPSCGGSILTNKFVLTAAHCTYDLTASDLTIRAGSSYRSSGGQLVAVKTINQHPSFNPDTYDYDLSVLELETTLVLGTNVQTIPLISSNTELNNGDLAVATGWGQLSDQGDPSEQLQVVSLPVITTATCRLYYSSSVVTDRMYCAGYPEGGKDTCYGDSGGPLALNGTLIGVTSWGDVCAQAGSPGAFTKLSLFRDYIDPLIK